MPSVPVSVSSPWALTYGEINGQLFRYTRTGLCAFESPIPNAIPNNRKCILLGGLSDGLLPLPYTQRLQELCIECNYSLIQPIVSSSYLGFGHSSLDQDIQELDELISHIRMYRSHHVQQQHDQQQNKVEGESNENSNENDELSICLIGHSTGCQDIVHYLQNDNNMINKQYITNVVLQGPVSDREASTIDFSTSDTTSDNDNDYKNDFSKQKEFYLQQSIQLRTENKGDEMMPRDCYWAPITANRYYNLHAFNGMDDYFSSDYTTEQLQNRLQHLSSSSFTNNLQTVLVVWSGKDEYVPEYVTNGQEHLQRLVTAMNSNNNNNNNNNIAKGLYLENGNHNLSSNVTDVTTMLQSIKEMLFASISKIDK